MPNNAVVYFVFDAKSLTYYMYVDVFLKILIYNLNFKLKKKTMNFVNTRRKKMSNKLFTLEKIVEFYLENIPETRDNDMLLCGLYYEGFYGTSNLVFLAGKNVPPYESISRCRRKIQARGEYLPSKEASAFRKAHYKEVLEYVRNESTEEDEKSQ